MVGANLMYLRDKNCAILIPHYNTPLALERLLAKISPHLYEQTLVIDDGSEQMPRNLPCPMIRHSKNQGYGAAQKSGYLHILHNEAWQHITHIAMVHGDNQYDIHSIWSAAKEAHSIQLGSRHLEPAPPEYPLWRKWGNHALTGLANRAFNCSYSDLHTGARIYSREFLTDLHWDKLSDDFVFDHQLLSIALASEIPIIEFPIPANYGQNVSSISFVRSVEYGLGCLHSLWAAKRAKF